MFGVEQNDISLLAQMMIASCRNRLGDGTANMMMAAASGIKVIEGNNQLTAPEQQGDQSVIDGSHDMIKNNPQLSLMFGSFIAKSQMYKMQQPDLEIEGVPKEDTSTDPAKDPARLKANGKHTNGKVARAN
jgi:hypothetical protein